MHATKAAKIIAPTTTVTTMMIIVVVLSEEDDLEEENLEVVLETTGLEEGGGVSKMVGTFIADARNLSKLTEPNLFIVMELLYF